MREQEREWESIKLREIWKQIEFPCENFLPVVALQFNWIRLTKPTIENRRLIKSAMSFTQKFLFKTKHRTSAELELIRQLLSAFAGKKRVNMRSVFFTVKTDSALSCLISLDVAEALTKSANSIILFHFEGWLLYYPTHTHKYVHFSCPDL